ncbi:26S proteasome non ATPase regulatory subunit 12 [Trichuris trichiura]|uniref:26S proteasome non ATPase regulatory subunit 12 n=1 Tax=Trichuris trichiura TaxID=36087 RepID=A0A077Z1G3_TRITR|nr:26S proteasome non ATPase regulatory subunit 12 [Trichuris trichiura]
MGRMLPTVNAAVSAVLIAMEANESTIAEYGDGRLMKMEVDLTSSVDETLKEAEQLQKEGKWEQAVELMTNLEKKTRQVADMKSNTRLQVAIVTACFNAGDIDALISNIHSLTKKRSLIKQSMTEMVRTCYSFLSNITDKESKINLIEALRSVAVGKIYVEVERARLTVMLSKIREEEGNLEEAKAILLDLQVESCGSMNKREKIDVLLHQLRLCVELGDFLRANMVSKKISPKVFTTTTDEDDDELQRIHVQYQELMIKVAENEKDYFAICRHYLTMSKIPLVKGDTCKHEMVLKNFILYALLSPHNTEQFSLLNYILTEKVFEQLPEYRSLVQLFVRQELLNWQNEIVEPYEDLLRRGTPAAPPTGIFDPSTDAGRARWENFKVRAAEHSMRMIAKYYSQISLHRMAELLDWDINSTEEFLCRLINNGTITGAKINRPAVTVRFKSDTMLEETIDNWVSYNALLMSKMSKAAHLISKEQMLQQTFATTSTPRN